MRGLTRKVLKLMGCTGIFFTLSGCASVSITSLSVNDYLRPESKSQPITISPYPSLGEIPKNSNTTLYLNPKTKHIHLGSLKNNPTISKPSEAIAISLSKFLENNGIATSINPIPPKNGVWVSGQAIQEIKGSRALRTLVGLGAGRSKIETKTLIFNASKSTKIPWITVWTSGGSNREPGVIFAAMPSPILAFNIAGAVGVGATLVSHSQKGLTQDGKRTGRTIGALILSEMNKPKNGIRSPKFLGQINNPNISIPFGELRFPSSATQTLR